MFGEFLDIIFRSIKLDKTLYSDNKNFGEASIYFAGLIMILDGIAGAIAANTIIKTSIGISGITAIFAWFVWAILIYVIGVKLFPDKKTNIDLSRLQGFFEVRLAKSIPAAGIILIDNNEFCVGGLDVPDSDNTLIGMWMNQPELARLANLIFDNLYQASKEYKA